MPTPIIYEKHQSRSFTTDAKTASLDRVYHIQGTNDESEAYELLVLTTPVVYAGLIRKTLKAESQGGGIWVGTVSYDAAISEQEAAGQTPENPEGPDAGGDGPVPIGPNISWDTTGGTAHITQSRLTRSATPAAGVVAPDTKQAIGVTPDEVKGCDVYVPQFNWQITVKRATCTFAYMKAVRTQTAKVNYDKKFYGFEPGEVLYLGASAQYSGSGQWEITHKFGVQPNEVNLAVGNGIIVPAKKGWDYLWIGYAKNTDANVLLNVPNVAYVERVYAVGNFDLLEIGA
jgi:hypothetical protein